MRRSAILLLLVGGLFVGGPARADMEQAKLVRDLTVGAANDVHLKAGQLVQVMKESGTTDVIMAQAADGTSGVYQVDATALALVPAAPVAPAPALPKPAPPVASVAAATPPVAAPASGAAASASAPANGMADALQGHLVSWSEGEVKDFDAGTLGGIKYWLVYFSASWCPYCQTSTPELVRFYHFFKSDHPNFELVLVCHDKSEDAMKAYLQSDDMPWPALRYGDVWNQQLWPVHYIARGIPNLVLVDDSGKVLTQTYVNGAYREPEAVIDDIKTLVPEPETQL